jgi:hypothetical protein
VLNSPLRRFDLLGRIIVFSIRVDEIGSLRPIWLHPKQKKAAAYSNTEGSSDIVYVCKKIPQYYSTVPYHQSLLASSSSHALPAKTHDLSN